MANDNSSFSGNCQDSTQEDNLNTNEYKNKLVFKITPVKIIKIHKRITYQKRDLHCSARIRSDVSETESNAFVLEPVVHASFILVVLPSLTSNLRSNSSFNHF